jgi:hypothetical protein
VWSVHVQDDSSEGKVPAERTGKEAVCGSEQVWTPFKLGEREIKPFVAGNQRVIAYLIGSHFSANPSPHITSTVLLPTQLRYMQYCDAKITPQATCA